MSHPTPVTDCVSPVARRTRIELKDLCLKLGITLGQVKPSGSHLPQAFRADFKIVECRQLPLVLIHNPEAVEESL